MDVKQPIQKDYQLLSYLGRVNLSAYDKYLLTASLRADGSSKFKKGNRWAYFPSFSLAWRMEQEAYMKPRIEAALEKYLVPQIWKHTTVCMAAYQNHAGMLGALYHLQAEMRLCQ